MFNRRKLLGLFAVGAASPIMGRQNAAEQTGQCYLYNWQSGETDDPRCEPLGYREDSPHIYLDGKLVTDDKVTCCKSGRYGWIKILVGFDGWPQYRFLHGDVIVIPKNWKLHETAQPHS